MKRGERNITRPGADGGQGYRPTAVVMMVMVVIVLLLLLRIDVASALRSTFKSGGS